MLYFFIVFTYTLIDPPEEAYAKHVGPLKLNKFFCLRTTLLFFCFLLNSLKQCCIYQKGTGFIRFDCVFDVKCKHCHKSQRCIKFTVILEMPKLLRMKGFLFLKESQLVIPNQPTPPHSLIKVTI